MSSDDDGASRRNPARRLVTTRRSIPRVAASAAAGSPLAAVVLLLCGAERLGGAPTATVAIVALAPAFLLGLAHLGLQYRKDGHEHREAMREHEVSEVDIRYRTVSDTVDREWSNEELRLLLAAEHQRSLQHQDVVPRPRAAPHDATSGARHRAD